MNRKNFILVFLLLAPLIFLAQKSVTGVITSVKGKMVSISCEVESPFVKGDSCNISKDISGNKNPLGINISSGWMGVGRAVVSSVNKNLVTIKVVKETSNIVINGKKQEHFIPGKKLRLEQ